MAELMRRPTNKEVEYYSKLIEDPIIFGFLIGFIKKMNSGDIINKFNPLRNDFDDWKAISRRLIRNGKYVLLCLELERIALEVADNQWSDLKIPKEIPKRFTKKNYLNSLNKKAKITDIARKYGINVKGKIALCPFHADKNPSLTFSDEKNVFRCFGCNVKGDILTFVKMMEELKDGNKRRS